jgi:hypothetical protein
MENREVREIAYTTYFRKRYKGKKLMFTQGLRGRDLFVLVLVILSLAIFSKMALANDLSRRLGFGLGWPYVSLKYGLTPRFSIEGRGAFGEGIGVYGARLYYNFNPYDRAVIFTGLEGDYVNFDVDIEDEEEGMKGKGYVGYLFVGGEYFINDNFTFNLDIGPAYIDLTEGEFDLNVSGIEWLYNLGINFYLGSSKKEERPEEPKEITEKLSPYEAKVEDANPSHLVGGPPAPQATPRQAEPLPKSSFSSFLSL